MLTVKRIVGLSIALLLLSNIFACRAKKNSGVIIAVNQYVEHPNLEAVYNGFKVVVDDWSKRHGTQVEYDRQVAGGDSSTALQIARQQLAKNPRVILALATPSAQAEARTTSSVPIVFGAITDPVQAGLVKSLDAPGGNITGTSDIGPYDQQFELIRKLLPASKLVGVIRNPGEANSVASMKIIDAAVQKWGYQKVEVSVANTSEVLAAARSLVGRCDLFYMPADNTVLSALPAIASVADSRKIPLFVGDEGSVKLGAAATIGIDYYELGKATGEIAVKILDGANPSSIPVAVGKAGRLIVNPKAAAQQGLQFPEDLMKTAKVVE
jgi:putative ABC transport system substrate-binding protein